MQQIPKFPKTGLIIGIVVILLGLYCVALNSTGIGIFTIILGLGIIVLVCYFYKRLIDAYNIKFNHPEEYKRIVEERKIREEAEAKAKKEKLALLPECPICKNKENVKRISDFNRTTSVLAMGLASSKIGKQYECIKCGHKW